MKNNLSIYLDEVYHNTVSRNCIKMILKSKTEQEYLNKMQDKIDKIIKDIIEIKQSICVMDQFISYIYLNEDAHIIDGFEETVEFYITESNRLCNELNVKNQNLHDYIDILAIAKANLDMKGNLIDSERELLKKNRG